LVVCCPG